MANQDLRQYAYDYIKDQIVYCHYKPGTILKEQLLTDTLNVSRTPIREALNRLETEGFLRIIPKKGIFIQEISMADIAQLYQARIEMEPVVVRLAAPYIPTEKLKEFLILSESQDDGTPPLDFLEFDCKLHRLFLSYCNNKYFYEVLDKIMDQNIRVQICTNNSFRLGSARDEHSGVLQALLNKDVDCAVNRMREHLQNCRDCVYKFYMNW